MWPGKDDKRLCSWNALMIGALAEAGGAIPCDDYLDAAVACAEFVWRDLRDERGRLLRTYRDGERTSPPTSRTTRTWSRRS